jgi:hypothetical protein
VIHGHESLAQGPANKSQQKLLSQKPPLKPINTPQFQEAKPRLPAPSQAQSRSSGPFNSDRFQDHIPHLSKPVPRTPTSQAASSQSSRSPKQSAKGFTKQSAEDSVKPSTKDPAKIPANLSGRDVRQKQNLAIPLPKDSSQSQSQPKNHVLPSSYCWESSTGGS